MHKFLNIVFIGGVIFCSALSSMAQNSVWTDMHFMRQSEVWLQANNSAGLKFLPIDTISEISLSGAFDKGSFINYNQSNQNYTYGAQAESYFRLNDKVVLWGSINYKNFTGQNMGASAWIDPDFAPFNIVEYTDTLRGEKTMESYFLKGALSVDLTSKLTLGGHINYSSTNYVKKRDLRHFNMLMDLDLSIGALYSVGNIGELGFNYYYRKRVEETNFDTFGNTDQLYSSLISWGTFWGQVEGFGSDGFTGEDDNNPLIDKINGIAVQLNLHINQQLQFFNEFTLNNREGYYGIKSDITKIYTEHSANVIAYKGVLSYTRPKALHQLNMTFSNNTLENWRTNYYSSYDLESDITYIKYYTPTKVLKQTKRQANLEYMLHKDYKGYCPKWSLSVAATYNNREQNASVYPLYRNQSINQFIGKLNISRNITVNKHQYTVQLGTRFSSGNGTALDAGTYGSSTTNTSSLRSTDFNLYREFEYLTCTSTSVNGGFRYSTLWHKNNIRAYAQINYERTKAIDLQYISGDVFDAIHFRIGCAF